MNVNYKNNFVVDGECKFVDCNNEILNADITAEELLKAVKSLKNKKSCCSDCITNEMIKVSCTLCYNLYVDIFNLILRSDWREHFIKPLFKGGCVSDPSCYRGIAISSCLSTFFTKILHNRLENYLEQKRCKN
jgi:hypothetical protein